MLNPETVTTCSTFCIGGTGAGVVTFGCRELRTSLNFCSIKSRKAASSLSCVFGGDGSLVQGSFWSRILTYETWLEISWYVFFAIYSIEIRSSY